MSLSPTREPPSLPNSPLKMLDGPNLKRVDYLPWDDYFMASAILAAERSKDPTTQVGCVIVDADNKIIGTGYNGMPLGCHDDTMPWGKGNADPLMNKHTFVVHAEQNAILNSIGKITGCRLYTKLFPCNDCAKLIVQSKISEVIYMLDRESWEMEAARVLFKRVGIKFRHFKTQKKAVTIHFDRACYENDAKFDKQDA
ncbi:unnamed protein product, partial [Mesorhabditis spiculigera]